MVVRELSRGDKTDQLVKQWVQEDLIWTRAYAILR
jgi:hypothetical protein